MRVLCPFAEEVSKDYNAVWTTAIEAVATPGTGATAPVCSSYLVCDNAYNMIALNRTIEGGASEDDRAHLETVGSMHVSEFVNAIRPGSLVMNLTTTTGGDASTATAAPASAAGSGGSSGSSGAATTEEAVAIATDRIVPTHIFGGSTFTAAVPAPLTAAR